MSLLANRIGRTTVASAVARIKNDCAKITGILNEVRPQHRIDELGEIGARNVDLAELLKHRIAEHKLHPIHQTFRAADGEDHFHLTFFENHLLAVAIESIETVKALDTFRCHVMVAIDLGDFPNVRRLGHRRRHQQHCKQQLAKPWEWEELGHQSDGKGRESATP